MQKLYHRQKRWLNDFCFFLSVNRARVKAVPTPNFHNIYSTIPQKQSHNNYSTKFIWNFITIAESFTPDIDYEKNAYSFTLLFCRPCTIPTC